MTLAGKALPPGTVNQTASVYFSNNVLISKDGGVLTTHGPVTLGGAASMGSVPLGGVASQISGASYGLLSCNYLPLQATGVGSAVTTAGLLYLAALPLPGNTTITNLFIKIATAAASLTTAQNFAGLYTGSGQLVATTADLTTTIGTNTGFIKCPLSATFLTPAAPPAYYLGVYFNASVTQPVLSAYTGQVTVTSSVANLGSLTTFGNTAATYPFAVSATTGNTTALPASITMSSNTPTGAYALFAGAN